MLSKISPIQKVKHINKKPHFVGFDFTIDNVSRKLGTSIKGYALKISTDFHIAEVRILFNFNSNL